jgi:hypothetical protein
MLGAKISIVLLYQRLAPQQASKGMLFLYGCIGVWAVFAILAQSFQCGGNVIFTPEQCLSGSLQYPSIVLNIISDGLLAFWMAPRFWSLQGAAESRLIPIILFGLRIACTAHRVCFQHGQRRHHLVTDHACGFQSVSKPTIARLELTVADPDSQCRCPPLRLPRYFTSNQQSHRRLLHRPDRPARRRPRHRAHGQLEERQLQRPVRQLQKHQAQ